MKRSASLLVDNDSCTTSYDDYIRMTKDELVSALQERDDRISHLEQQCKRAKTTTTTTLTSAAPPPTISPEKIQQKVDQLRKLAFKGIKSQIKWRPSCKNGTARFAYTGICDETTFRGFLELNGKDKTKGGKVSIEKFQDDILKNNISVSIRYGYLRLNRDVNVTYNKTSCEIKITGGYGL